jgi:hypothetical protein
LLGNSKVLNQQSPLKVTKKTKTFQKTSPPLRTSQGTWARTNANKPHALIELLADVFQLHLSGNEPEEEEALIQLLEASYQLEPPTNNLKRTEVQEVISSLNPKKSMPIIGIK